MYKGLLTHATSPTHFIYIENVIISMKVKTQRFKTSFRYLSHVWGKFENILLHSEVQ
jgi:hypothetical protein